MVAEVCKPLGFLGVDVDSERNTQRADGPRIVSTPDSPATVLVVPTQAELSIARQVTAVVR